ncbi:MAG: hypothetical protein V3V97_22295 [Hyphomicrobiaceae bacterium]
MPCQRKALANGRVASGHLSLDNDSALQCIYGAGELDQRSIDRPLVFFPAIDASVFHVSGAGF